MSNNPTILVTGGTGYIGSHTVVSLIENGYEVVIIDNLSNSKKKVLERIEAITGCKPKFYQCDIRSIEKLDSIFSENKITAVIHFAALKSITDSLKNPCQYFENNISGTLSLLESMKKNNIKNIIFSSSASIYGDKNVSPISEIGLVECKNSYAFSKYSAEMILKFESESDSKLSVSILRYFNPIGAHQSGLIGEDSKNPTNIMPHILTVASKKYEIFKIYGKNYLTFDGTAVRDYIHVMDVANGHIAALKNNLSTHGLLLSNLGRGSGVSVLNLIRTFEIVNDIIIPFEFEDSREGDAGEIFANVEFANNKLGWVANKSLEDMCRDSWLWQCKNPNGY